MKRRRAFSWLIATAAVGAIAIYSEMTPAEQSSLLSATTTYIEIARTYVEAARASAASSWLTITTYIDEMTGPAAHSSAPAAAAGEPAPVRVAARPPDAAVEPPTSPGNPLWTLPLKQLSMTRDRPIFSPSRRPPPPATPTYIAPVAVRQPPKPVEPERPSITLLGTIISGAEGIGVFMEPATQNVMRLRVGEDHQGWTLRAVKTREATLVKDGEKVVLELPPPGDSASPTNDFTPEVQRAARRPSRR